MANTIKHCRDEEPNAITVFFPFFNEESNIVRVYEAASRVLEKMNVDYEIILIDDGSMDRTHEIADAIAVADSRVKVVHHLTNRGYGAALRSGFCAASKSLIFYADGDGQFDLAELPPLLPLLTDCDIISCFRISRRDSWGRRLNAWCWTSFICFIFGIKAKDINCAFKLYRRQIFDNIQTRSNGAMINTEILVRAIRHGYSVKYVGVHHFPRTSGRQTGAKLSVIFRAFWELAKLYNQIN